MRISRYYLLIFVLSLIPFFFVFSTSLFPHTHDGIVHLARMAAYFKALGDGNFPVRWASDLNYGYGMPLFDFIYPLPYWISSFFIFLGFSLVNSFKLVLLVSYILSGFFMFVFAKKFLGDNKKAFLTTVFYQFFPYRLIDLFVRGDIGEVYAFTFLPLVLYGLTSLFKKKTYLNFAVTGVASALLILSHNSLSLSFFIVACLFILFFAKCRANAFLGFISLFAGICLSAFYWLSALFDHRYTYGNLFMKEMFLSHFPPIQNLFIPNLNNSFALQTGGISVQIGALHIISLLSAIFVFLFFKKVNFSQKKIFIFCFILFGISIFFINSVSTILWQKISLLRQFQFPWRFLGILALPASLASIGFFSFKVSKNKLFLPIISLLVILSTIYYWKPPLGFDKVDEKYYWNYPLNTTYFGETDLIWSAGPKFSYPKSKVEVISGKGTISNFKKTANGHVFLADAETNISLVDHTQFFPGWRVFIDKNPAEIQFQDRSWSGEITFSVPPGKHFIEVVFGETNIRKIADFISIFALAGLFLLFLFRKRVFAR